MRVRKAQKSDYKNLMYLYNLFVGEDRYSKYSNDSFNRVLKNPNNFIYIVEDNNKLVGFVAFSIRDVIRYPKKIAELDELFVLSEYRNKGVGKRLMDEIKNKAIKLNCHRIFIESRFDHKGAHKFYEKLGYKNYGYHFIIDL